LREGEQYRIIKISSGCISSPCPFAASIVIIIAAISSLLSSSHHDFLVGECPHHPPLKEKVTVVFKRFEPNQAHMHTQNKGWKVQIAFVASSELIDDEDVEVDCTVEVVCVISEKHLAIQHKQFVMV
jgi:hypothetical protein